MPSLTDKARAKVNLTLAVQGRRADGYHVLDSLVTFAEIADDLTLTSGPDLSLSIEGPTAAQSGIVDDNLVLKAARILAQLHPGLMPGHFHLTKRLPVAAGIGGGSSDAAAALRLLARANGLPADTPALAEAARRTGADVPVCLSQQSRWMRGAGENLSAPVALRPLPAILLNPEVSTPTAGVFKALALPVGRVAPYDDRLAGKLARARDAVSILAQGRNDLEPPAFAMHPVIVEALDVLRKESGCRLARMSGSGATIFGIFETAGKAARACARLTQARPRWWIVATTLG